MSYFNLEDNKGYLWTFQSDAQGQIYLYCNNVTYHTFGGKIAVKLYVLPFLHFEKCTKREVILLTVVKKKKTTLKGSVCPKIGTFSKNGST